MINIKVLIYPHKCSAGENRTSGITLNTNSSFSVVCTLTRAASGYRQHVDSGSRKSAEGSYSKSFK